MVKKRGFTACIAVLFLCAGRHCTDGSERPHPRALDGEFSAKPDGCRL